MLTRRKLMATSAAAFAAAHAGAVKAQTARTTRLIVGFPPGGAIDVVARLLAEQMKDHSRAVIVENRSGAGGRLALETLKSAPADGSVLVLSPGDQLTLFPHVYKELSYSVSDFTAVAAVCAAQFVLTIGPSVPASVVTLAHFVGWARENPKLAAYGTPGTGTRQHFIGAMLARAAGFEFTDVPYRGGAVSLQDSINGQIAATISVASNALPHINSGSLRALATTASKRSALLGNVPTFSESGYSQLEGSEWFGIFAPIATPPDIVDGLSATVARALESEALQASLQKLTFDLAPLRRAEFAAQIATDLERWRSVVQATGFKPID